MLTAHISAHFPWTILLLSILSAVHSCHCHRISLRSAPCCGAREQIKVSAARSQTHFNSPFLGESHSGGFDVPRVGTSHVPASFLRDKAAAGSGSVGFSSYTDLDDGVRGSMAAPCFQKQESEIALIFLLLFHICHPLSPRFLSIPVPALQVFWSSAKIIQLANPANSTFHFLHLQLSVSAAVGAHCSGSDWQQWWVPAGRDPAAEREGRGDWGRGNPSPCAAAGNAEFTPLSPLAWVWIPHTILWNLHLIQGVLILWKCYKWDSTLDLNKKMGDSVP